MTLNLMLGAACAGAASVLGKICIKYVIFLGNNPIDNIKTEM